MPRKKGTVSRARVVEVLGPVGAPRMSPKKSAAAGSRLREVYPQLSSSASESLANHIHGGSRIDPTRELDYFLQEVETLFPELAAQPAPANVAPNLGKREDYPPFARPEGCLPVPGTVPSGRGGGDCCPKGGYNDRDAGAQPAGNGKLVDLPPASQPTAPGPRAKNSKGGGRDTGYGGNLGAKSLSLRAALG